MIEEFNRKALLAVAAPSRLDGEFLLCLHALAQWLVYLWPAILVLLWLFGGGRDRRAVVAATATGVLGLLAAHVVSGFVIHPRPFMLEPVRNFLDQAPGNSFPSSHAVLLFGLAFSTLGLAPPSFPRLGLVSALAASAVAAARMVLGAHYPLDLLGSIAIAAVAAGLVHSVWGRAATRRLTGFIERFYGMADPARNRLTR